MDILKSKKRNIFLQMEASKLLPYMEETVDRTSHTLPMSHNPCTLHGVRLTLVADVERRNKEYRISS